MRHLVYQVDEMGYELYLHWPESYEMGGYWSYLDPRRAHFFNEGELGIHPMLKDCWPYCKMISEDLWLINNIISR